MRVRLKGEVIFSLVWLFVFAVAIILALGYNTRARLAPLVVGIPGFLVMGVITAGELRKSKSNLALQAAEELPSECHTPTVDSHMEVGKDSGGHREWHEVNPFIWFTALVAAMYVLGFMVSVPLYLLTFFRFRWKETWLFSVIFSIVSWMGLYLVFSVVLHIPLYRGLLFRYVPF